MSKPTFTMTTETITVCIDGTTHSVRRGAPNFEGLKKALSEERWNSVPEYLTVAKAIESWSKGDFKVVGSEVRLRDTVLPTELSLRIVEMVRKNEDPAPVLRFWERLSKNPSFRSVNQLWGFLQHKNIPLTEDGCFLAYKSIRSDYKDHHSGTIGNKIGTINEMPRNQISDDPNVACHDGFHVGALGYAKTFGTGECILVVCKVDPKDVVCVPFDSRQEKMRVCRYEVVGHYGSELPSTTYKAEESPVIDEDEDELDDDILDEDEAELHDEDEEELENEDPDDAVGIYPQPKTAKAPKAPTKSKTKKPTKVKVKAGKKKPHNQTRVRYQKGGVKTTTKVEKKKPSKFDRLSEEQLLEQSIEDLRKYASSVLKIMGAYKIPGGKLALIGRIMEIRQK